ncbi:Alg9-like mannosyltransferase family-domain-containing protein [Aspergillus cavernicola]|uniref:Mannosyltransferase n=1 Tax=Aspergillus cavernicola TaxID=176166 RepID=A0ABR4HXL0_9EURO
MWRDAGYVLLLVSIPALVLVHLSIAPYTKVEESFHIQAIHDIETYGIPARDVPNVLRVEYDHFTFPGAVPRTFAGAVALSGLSSPFIWLKNDINRQFTARAILGLFNAFSLLSFATGLRRTAGRTAAVWYLLFQASQFHVIYYASRTLSNMFAFGMTTFALATLLPEPVNSVTYRKRSRLALYLLTIAGIVFRAELALFLATHTLFLFATGRVSIQREILPAGILGLILGLSITVPVDSFFWQQMPLWPELAAFKFNVLAGQASAWGTHPWHYYFSNAMPRLLLNPLTYLIGIPISLFQPATRRITTSILIPSLTYVLIYSAQPHKEWRFIVYAIPPLTAAAAIGTSYIWTHRTKSFLYRLLSLGMIGSTLVSFLASSFILLPASSANYPGAQALNALHTHAHASIQNTTPKTDPIPISIHLGNLACQTGVTRFLQLPHHHQTTNNTSTPQITWTYDKTESPRLKSTSTFWLQFNYALLEPTEAEKLQSLSSSSASSDYNSQARYSLNWEDVETIYGFAGLRLLKPGDEATSNSSSVEERILRWIYLYLYSGSEESADGFVELWNGFRETARGVTRGWWVEVRMEPRIVVLRRI